MGLTIATPVRVGQADIATSDLGTLVVVAVVEGHILGRSTGYRVLSPLTLIVGCLV